jgi:hypothetical protein
MAIVIVSLVAIGAFVSFAPIVHTVTTEYVGTCPSYPNTCPSSYQIQALESLSCLALGYGAYYQVPSNVQYIGPSVYQMGCPPKNIYAP